MQKQQTILMDIDFERKRQDAIWGQQNHTPEGWLPILAEEFGEVAKAMNDKNWADYQDELVQVAAVCVAMLESFRRNVR